MVSGRRSANAPAGRSSNQLGDSAGSGGELLLAVRRADLHLARLGLLENRDPDLENAVVVGGLDRIRVQVLRQTQATGKSAHRPLPHEDLVGPRAVLLPLNH